MKNIFKQLIRIRKSSKATTKEEFDSYWDTEINDTMQGSREHFESEFLNDVDECADHELDALVEKCIKKNTKKLESIAK